MGGYKEHSILDMLKRKSIIIKYIVFIALIFVVTLMLFIETTKEKASQSIVYTENSEVDYRVYLKDNDFFQKGYLEKDNQYIASLIDYIKVDFEYLLESEEKNVDYNYVYKVVAETNVEEKSNNNSLYNFTEDLIEEKEYNANTNSTLKIDQSIKVDYKKYNDIVKNFLGTYDLADDSKSTLTINMYVDVIGENEKVECNTDSPVMSITIPLSTKTMAIDIETNSVNENSVCETVRVKQYMFGAIVLLIIDICLVISLFIFIKDTKDEKAIYNMRLKRIMSNYGSYIQKLNNEFDFTGYQILEIKSFEDLLQIKESMNLPILMTEKSSAMETYFFIPSDKNVYIYELRIGNLRRTRARINK